MLPDKVSAMSPAPTGSAASIVFDPDILFAIYRMAPADDFCPEDTRTLQTLGVVAVFCISHRRTSVESLRRLLRSLLERYGGYVGHDTEGFQPIFTAKTLPDFSYPQDW